MEKQTTSHISILWLFASLVIILTIPLILFTSQQKQDIRQFAAKDQPSPEISPAGLATGSISGYIYQDLNQNGERDYQEFGIKDIRLNIIQFANNLNQPSVNPEFVTAVTTDKNGFFKYRYTYPYSRPIFFSFQLVLPDGYKTINTNPADLKITQNNDKNILEFGIFPIRNNINPPDVNSKPMPTIYKYIE